MKLFCAAIRRDSVYLLRFPFLSHVQVLSFEISLVCHLRVFHNTIYLWSFTGVWITASLLSFPRLFFVFLPILTMYFLDSSSDFLFLQSFFQVFGDRSERVTNNWYYHHLHIPRFFLLPGNIQVFFVSLSFIFTPWSARKEKITWWQILSFLLINTKCCLLTCIRYCKSQRISCTPFSITDSGLCIIIIIIVNFSFFLFYSLRVFSHELKLMVLL